MSVQPVGAVGGSVAGVSAVSGLSPALPPVASDGAGADFAGALQQAGGAGSATIGRLEDLQRLQSTADDLAVKAVTGQLADPSQYTIAATEATLATQMTVALRNKAVEAYSEIMRMQL